MKAHYLLRGHMFGDLLLRTKAERENKSWAKRGRLGPPNGVKQRMVLDFARRYHADTLVETGTYLGDMIYAVKDHFKDIYSIELSKDLHKRASASFRKYPHVHLTVGDSATSLPSLLRNISTRSLFWLDGHYSGGVTATAESWTPIVAELDAIRSHSVQDHVLLIDDAVCFNGQHGYPTLFAVQKQIAESFPHHEMQVFDNVIQVTPR